MSQIRSKNGLNGFIVIYHISRNSSHRGSYFLFQSALQSPLGHCAGHTASAATILVTVQYVLYMADWNKYELEPRVLFWVFLLRLWLNFEFCSIGIDIGI